MTLCRIHNLTPFSLFKEDMEEVIMVINYWVEKGKDKKIIHSAKNNEVRIKVNDKTATGGWY